MAVSMVSLLRQQDRYNKLNVVWQVGPGAAVNLYCGEQEKPSDLSAEKDKVMLGSTLPFANTMKSTDYQYSMLDENEALRRSQNSLNKSTNSIASLESHDMHRSPDKKIGLPTIIEHQQSSQSMNISQEIDEKANKAEKTK